MQDFLNVINNLKKQIGAMDRGVKKFVSVSPLLVKQHIVTLAKRKLNSTKDEYIDAVNARLVDGVLIVELDKDSWIANAVEEGADPFSIKEGLLRSKKAKVSKKGHRYIHVPMQKDKHRKEMGTEKGQEIQDQIITALENPQYGLMKYKGNQDGSVWEYQSVLSGNVEGLYRARLYKSKEEVGNKKPQWGHIMFRSASSNPLSESQWNHPGIQAANIFRETEIWFHQAAPMLLENFIEEELSKL